jgi:hypothetical protein
MKQRHGPYVKKFNKISAKEIQPSRAATAGF